MRRVHRRTVRRWLITGAVSFIALVAIVAVIGVVAGPDSEDSVPAAEASVEPSISEAAEKAMARDLAQRFELWAGALYAYANYGAPYSALLERTRTTLASAEKLQRLDRGRHTACADSISSFTKWLGSFAKSGAQSYTDDAYGDASVVYSDVGPEMEKACDVEGRS